MEDNPPASILDLLKRYPRNRLFIHPLLWTEVHLRVLRCKFKHISIGNADIDTEMVRQGYNKITLNQLQSGLQDSNFYVRQKAVEALIAQKVHGHFIASR